MSKTIRVEEETHASLAALKGDDETFDDLLSRLVRERRAAASEGAGLWADSDAAEKAREARREMKDGVGSR
jgi:predicted CopG family antitoxin